MNKIKPDTILKNFWRNNDRFADLFNTVLFGEEKVLKPDMLVEADTDVSSPLKFNGHAETVQRVIDVVKKSFYGIDFVIWGLENQQRIHYAMPLRHLVGDAFSYLKEYDEIAAKNRKEKKKISSDEFLSSFQKTDRLHPIITLCLYYGETPWDGPTNLLDMLDIPEEIRPFVSDYRMNLFQIRDSGKMEFCNEDVRIVFDFSCSIYNREYDKINKKYKKHPVSTELGMVIGAITESQKLIDHALESEKRGGAMNMCTALEELRRDGIKEGMEKGMQEGMEKGIREGMQKGIQKGMQDGIEEGTVKGCLETYKELEVSLEDARSKIIRKFSLSEEAADKYIKKYW